MTEMGHYELPHGGYNGVELVGEFAYKEALLRVLPRLPADGAPVEATVPVEIVPEPDNPYDRRAVSVRAHGQVIGYLSRELAADYHLPVKRIVASGAVLRSNARVYAYVDYRGEPEISAWVGLPEPEWLAPLNDGYPATTSVLPYGRQTYQVTKEDQHFDHLFNFVPKSGKGPVLLTLHSADTMLRNGTVRRTVEVRLDGEKAGELTAATSAHYLPVIDHADGMGRVVGVWGTITGSGLAAELTIKGAKSTELSDEWLREMPLFPRLVPEAHSYEVPGAYLGKPKGKRPSAHHGGPRPADHTIAQTGPAAELRASSKSEVPLSSPDSPAAATPPRPTGSKKRATPQPPSNARPVRLSDTVVHLGEGSGQDRPIYYAVKGKTVYVTDKERASRGTHPRRTAWLFISGVLLVGLVLGAIPVIGPFILLAAILLAWIGGADQLRKASALEVDPSGAASSTLASRHRQAREWGDVGEENQDPGGEAGA